MAEDLVVSTGSKQERYETLLPQIQALVSGETDALANRGNVCAALKYGLGFFWVGFYFIKANELVLEAFQGPIACTRIKKGKGVCGTAWEKNEIIIVPDVDAFPGHIACSSLSKSEIVLPVYDRQQQLIGVLDVDSETYNTFDEVDAFYLSKILTLLNNQSS